ncbi:LysR substrate-binding domain-containing protein [Rubritalea tangerina]|uniref:LysR substrate-binding domain-containing protein n=2 Tax=Rubritalea tangerina TaxID=430798 RepID=A0ABW4Z9G6_9BACT
MNVHHLELFYYVAKYEGITAAVRKMPYGIQQPAVSGQILQLEEELGVKLFNRRPFALTPAGEMLYDFAYPFFAGLPDVEERLRGEDGKHLRITASASVLGNHLPYVLEKLKLKIPELKLTLKEVEPSELHTQLTTQQADIALTVLHGKLDEGLRSCELMTIPLVLLVPSTCKINTLEQLIRPSDVGDHLESKLPLVGLPENEALSQIFQSGLREKNIQWQASMEVNALDIIQRYVSRGFGAGIGVGIPGVKPIEGVDVIPLDGFDPLVVGAIYQGSMKPIAKEFLQTAQEYVAGIASNK